MYAIVEIAGQQFKVEKGQEIFVNRLEGDEGARVKFEEVLLIDNRGKISVGAPVVAGVTVSAKILEHLKGDKVLVVVDTKVGLHVVSVILRTVGIINVFDFNTITVTKSVTSYHDLFKTVDT